MNATETSLGARLAAALNLPIIGTEGHDLKIPCVSCKSSDAGRLHEDEGVYHCYSCNKNLSAWDLCKVVVGHDQAKQVMHAVGLFPEVFEAGKGSGPAANSNGDNQPAGSGKPKSDDEILATVAAEKGCSVQGLLAYGAIVRCGEVGVPMFAPDGSLRSWFRLIGKGLCQKDKPAGIFAPCRERRPCFPDAGEQWVLTESVKNCAVYHDLGLLAIGTQGAAMRLKSEYADIFRGVDVTFCPDGDKPSLDGAAYDAKLLAGKARSVRLARLPYKEIRDSHGDDVRDLLKQLGKDAGPQIQQAILDAQPIGSDRKPAEPMRFVEMFNCQELLALDLRTEYLVHGVLAAGQPTIIGGRSKTLKTSLACDLVVSLGSGARFLGKFLTHRVPVAFWSGESGAATIKETALRIAAAKEVNLADCSIYWAFDLPRLSQADHLQALRSIIGEKALKVAVLDPLYLCLLCGDAAGLAGNLYAMGAVLQPLSRLGQETGCTLVLLHHFRKTGQLDDGEPAGLEELAMSGAAEWARQWLLLQRRRPYQSDGHHELYLRCGGSAGHGSLWALDLNEGILDPDLPTSRKWEVEVKPVADARAEAKHEKENRKATAMEEREGEHVDRVRRALQDNPDGVTEKRLRTLTRLNAANLDRALLTLEKTGRVEPCKVTTGGGTYGGWKIKKP